MIRCGSQVVRQRTANALSVSSSEVRFLSTAFFSHFFKLLVQGIKKSCKIKYLEFLTLPQILLEVNNFFSPSVSLMASSYLNSVQPQ